MKFFRTIREADLIPSGYGICWRREGRNETVCAPIPLNHVCRWLYGAWIYLRNPPLTWWEKQALGWYLLREKKLQHEIDSLKFQVRLQDEIEKRRQEIRTNSAPASRP